LVEIEIVNLLNCFGDLLSVVEYAHVGIVAPREQQAKKDSKMEARA